MSPSNRSLEKKRQVQRACDVCRRKKSNVPALQFSRHSQLMTSSVRCERPPSLPPPPLIVLGEGRHIPYEKCSNCAMYSSECTYVEATKVRLHTLPLLNLSHDSHPEPWSSKGVTLHTHYASLNSQIDILDTSNSWRTALRKSRVF